MASASPPTSLPDRAEELTARHLRDGFALTHPRQVVAQSPLLEVLIDEIATPLPPPLAARFKAAPTAACARHWLVAGAVYASIENDPYLARRFLDELGDDPERTGLALAKAFAARLEPPPRSALWHASDRLGLVLQVAFACAALLMRGLLLQCCVGPLDSIATRLSLLAVVHGLFRADLLLQASDRGLASTGLLLGAMLWFGLEAAAFPAVMEWLRQFPARRQGLPPPLAWRIDVFYLVWFAQASALFWYFEWHLLRYLAAMVRTEAVPAEHWAMVVALGLPAIAVSGIVVLSARSTLRLGTGRLESSTP
jgi:hypothetical protein